MIEKLTQKIKKALTGLNNVMCRGVLKSVDASTPQNTQVPLASVTCFDNETISGIEFAQDWGFMSSPPADGTTETIVGFLQGQRDHGFVMKSFNRKNPSTKPILAAGESCMYNKVNGTNIILKADGSIQINSTVGMTFNMPTATFTGQLIVDGDLIDNATGANINNETMRDLRNTYNSHTHPGVAPGGANTGIPNQQET